MPSICAAALAAMAASSASAISLRGRPGFFAGEFFGSGNPYWWQSGGQNMRTVSLSGNHISREGLGALVERLHSDGVTVVVLNSVYDSGLSPDSNPYPGGDLCDGLAINKIDSANPWVGMKGLDDALSKAHGYGMKVMTWLNPSYVWTGADLFKRAENAVKGLAQNASVESQIGDVHNPARLFKWHKEGGQQACCSSGSKYCMKPDDNDPKGCSYKTQLGGTGTKDDPVKPEADSNGWVYSKDAGRCYMSMWAMQPSGDFSTRGWKDFIQGALSIWIEKGIDGFVLDAPNYYIDGVVGGVARTGSLKTTISDYVHERASASGDKIALFGELYSDPVTAANFELDGALWGEYSETSIYDAIYDKDGTADQVESALEGFDRTVSLGFRTGWEAVTFQRTRPHYNGTAPNTYSWVKGNILAEAITAAGGYISDVTFIERSDDDADWWSANFYPGEGRLKDFYESIGERPAFNHLSLRVPFYPGSHKVSSFIRYDAFGSGEVAVFAGNVANSTASLNVLGAFGTRVRAMLGGVQGLPTSGELDLEEFGFGFRGLVKPLPSWSSLAFPTSRYLNCYAGKGSDEYNTGDPYKWHVGNSSYESMPLGACFLSCLEDAQCSSVTVQWLDDGKNVKCFGRGAVVAQACVDYKKSCEAGGEDCYSTFVSSA